ncbi:hypothetical protein LP420_25735 [Massilia sp. B-10]|nr:hypothetical protein LP420_25735 [Massilia sp. B-10]
MLTAEFGRKAQRDAAKSGKREYVVSLAGLRAFLHKKEEAQLAAGLPIAHFWPQMGVAEGRVGSGPTFGHELRRCTPEFVSECRT